jgi:hypothetical protein
MAGLLVAVLVGGLAAQLGATTLTLQDGLNGYSGTADSYIEYGGKRDEENVNFGEAPTVILNAEQYNAS